MANSPRILHCPTSTGGNPQSLARAERKLGLKSKSIVLQQNFLQYASDEVLTTKDAGRWQVEIARWKLLVRTLREFDIIHFNFGESLMPNGTHRQGRTLRQSLAKFRWVYSAYARLFELRDLPLLRRAEKGIVVTYQGDDARQGDFTRANFAINMAAEVEANYYSNASDEHKRWRIQQIAKYADRIYAVNPDLLRVLPSNARFIPYASVDLTDWKPISLPSATERTPVVLHAPSHRGAKGTRFVLDAVARLQHEGIAMEFVLVEGMSNAEARVLYEKADLLIDQVLAGWYGGLAVELMALGKPVICYIREEDLQFIPEQMAAELPIIQATPASLYETLKEWVTIRRHELPAVGVRSRSYVENWHDPLKIAAMLKQDYTAIMAIKRGG